MLSYSRAMLCAGWTVFYLWMAMRPASSDFERFKRALWIVSAILTGIVWIVAWAKHIWMIA